MALLDRVFLREFIKQYEQFPELWNIMCDTYHNKYKKQKAYEKLLEKLKEIEPQATLQTLKRKINTLRSNYRRELKKIKCSKMSGAGPDEIYVTSLWYFDDLHFLNSQETQKVRVSSSDLEEEYASYDGVEFPTKRRRKLATSRSKLLARAVECLENSAKAVDEASAVSASWGALYKNLDAKQKLYANKVINEALYQGAFGKLNENSHKALEAQCTSQPRIPFTARSQSVSTNNSISSLSPMASPEPNTAEPAFAFIETQPEPIIQYTIVPDITRVQRKPKILKCKDSLS